MHYKNFFQTQITFGEEHFYAKKLLPLCDFYLGKTKTNLLGQDNFPSNLYDESLSEVNEDPLVVEFLNYIKEKYIKKIISDRNLNYKDEYFRKSFGFFSSMGRGSQLRKHSHQDCQFSGILYLDIGDNVPDLIFYDPRPHPKFQTVEFYTKNYVNIKPQTGLFMVWDHWLEHEVDIKRNDEPRKAFSFNI